MEDSWDRKSNKRLKSLGNGGSGDQISDLPDAIAQHILSFLPAKDAIRTCVLSKRWTSLWTSIPNLFFHCESPQHNEVRKFASFVGKTLKKYTSAKMNKFSLRCTSQLQQLGSWLRFVENCEVKEISLQLPHIPKSLYTNSSVINMSLNSYYLDKGSFYWTSLKILSLTESSLGNDLITSILQGSPLMECLTLRECRLCGLDRIDASGTKLKVLVLDGISRIQSHSPIDIVAPNLVSLTIVQFINDPMFNLVDVSSSLEANMDFTMGILSYNREKKMLKDLVQTLAHISKLTVGIRYCQDRSIDNPICARYPLRKLKSLEVDIKLTKWCRPGLSALLYGSLDAEQLTINLMSSNHCEEKFFGYNGYLRQPTRRYDYLTQPKRRYFIRHLKSVKIVVHGSCSNSKDVLFEVVKYLLDNANALKKLIIHAGANCSTSAAPKTFKELYEITQKLLSYPRASTDAVVLFESNKSSSPIIPCKVVYSRRKPKKGLVDSCDNKSVT